MSKVQIAALNRASKEITSMTFLSAIHQQHPDILEVVHKALEYYALDCLEEAAGNATTKDELVWLEDEQRHVFSHVVVDKASITSKENLA